MIEGWLDVATVARRLEVSVQAVHGLTNRGTLAFCWMGGRKFIRGEALEKLIADPAYGLKTRRTETGLFARDMEAQKP